MTRRGKNNRRNDGGIDNYDDRNNNKQQPQQTANSETKRKSTTTVKDSDKVKKAKAKGADIVDVTDYIDVTEVGKSFRTNNNVKESADINALTDDKDSITTTDDEDSSDTTTSSTSTEVWGEDARIVDDYEGRSIIVDGLSRTVIEYTGANNTIVQAYVVGSRLSLRNFLRGGQSSSSSSSSSSRGSGKTKDSTDVSSSSSSTSSSSVVYSSMEEEVYAIQRKREVESKRGLIRPDEADGIDDTSDPDTGTYSIVERDYGDWGVYTPTGAQLSASEVQGVLLLSDVAGPFTQYTQTLADKIAFECQPVVVLVPDLFRGKPWTMINDTSSRNEDGLSYEEWRSMHPDRRVDVDIRAAASVLRERYAVSSLAIWGTCYGGGRALEAAAGYYVDGPNSYYTDVYSNRPPPPHVDPVAAVVWYPTRYNVTKLFGKDNEGFRTFTNGQERSVAVLAVFAEDDTLLGATPEDAMLLKDCLEDDPRIKDFMVKVFPDQKHGFAHLTTESDDVVQDGIDLFNNENFGSSTESYNSIGGDAEVACLLSTAWVETYTRVFLPTVGTPVRYDDGERWSASTIEMQGYSANERRDVRAELDKALSNYNDVDIDLGRMSQSTSPCKMGQVWTKLRK
jgi:dienelactone hydrolase